MSDRSCFVPTPGLQTQSYSFILLRLVQHRISSILDGKTFEDDKINIIRAFLPHPPEIRDSEARAHYVQNETQSIILAFNSLEMDPDYQQALHALANYKGWRHHCPSATMAGVQVLIQSPVV